MQSKNILRVGHLTTTRLTIYGRHHPLVLVRDVLFEYDDVLVKRVISFPFRFINLGDNRRLGRLNLNFNKSRFFFHLIDHHVMMAPSVYQSAFIVSAMTDNDTRARYECV